MPAETRDLAGTVVAITGATAGIGAAAARLLVEAGANVALNGRRQDRLDALIGRARYGPGGRRCPATSGRRRTTLRSCALHWTGGGDWTPSCRTPGSGCTGASWTTPTTRSRAWSTRTSRAPCGRCGPRFRPCWRPPVVATSSSWLRWRGFAVAVTRRCTPATKFAQVGLAGALDRELRETGVRVSAVCPAGVETEFALGAGRTAGDPSMEAYLRPGRRRPRGRHGAEAATTRADHAVGPVVHGTAVLKVGSTDERERRSRDTSTCSASTSRRRRRRQCSSTRPVGVAAVGVSEYGFDTPRPGWSEQDPALWWTAAQARGRGPPSTTPRSQGDAVRAVGLTGQMHGSVLLDRCRRGGPPGAAVERPTNRSGVRRDPRARRSRAAGRS